MDAGADRRGVDGVSQGSGESAAAAGPGSVMESGKLEGDAYQIDVPANGNVDLLLDSHGYVAPGS